MVKSKEQIVDILKDLLGMERSAEEVAPHHSLWLSLSGQESDEALDSLLTPFSQDFKRYMRNKGLDSQEQSEAITRLVKDFQQSFEKGVEQSAEILWNFHKNKPDWSIQSGSSMGLEEIPTFNKNKFENQSCCDQTPIIEDMPTTDIGRVDMNSRSSWRVLDIREGPENHSEFYCSSSIAPEAKIIGARVRGKKHKHEGTNCDDWFEIANSNGWSIIAVSDGAGSKALSRIGAKVSCRTAVERLSKDLPDMTHRSVMTTGAGCSEKGLLAKEVQTCIRIAVQEAYRAVEQAAKRCAEDVEHVQALGREPKLNDFAATLLIAVNTTITIDGMKHGFTATYQIGDGAIAGMTADGSVYSLTQPDMGDYSGQTSFLISEGVLDSIASQVYFSIMPFKTIFVMSDGVADDYFPVKNGIPKLYEDLIMNEILEGSEKGFSQCEHDCTNQLVESSSKPEEKLCHWLDTYSIRGSFDDRTLVVLMREEY